MSKHYAIKESISVHGTPVESFWSTSLTGEPVESNIYYIGDMWEVVTRCQGFEGDEIATSEYFSSLSAARDYAATV
jgi:hypothetical protein